MIPLSVPQWVCKSARDSTFAVVFGVWASGASQSLIAIGDSPGAQKIRSTAVLLLDE